MSEGTQLFKAIKEIAAEAAGTIKARLLYGRVIATAPLRVRVDQRFDLPEEFLIFPKSLEAMVIEVVDTQPSGSVTTRRIQVKAPLALGDKLILMNLEDKYLVLDKVGDPNGINTYA